MSFSKHYQLAYRSRQWLIGVVPFRWFLEIEGSQYIAQSWCSQSSTCLSIECMGTSQEWYQERDKNVIICRYKRFRSQGNHCQSPLRRFHSCLCVWEECSQASNRSEWFQGTSCILRLTITEWQISLSIRIQSLGNCTFWWTRTSWCCTSRKRSKDGFWKQSSHGAWLLFQHCQDHSPSEEGATWPQLQPSSSISFNSWRV